MRKWVSRYLSPSGIRHEKWQTSAYHSYFQGKIKKSLQTASCITNTMQ